MLAALPAEEEAWLEVLSPWLDEMWRAAHDLPPDAPVARALQHTAR